MKRAATIFLLLHGMTLFGQDNPVEGWQKKLQAFYTSTPPVVVHLFFNQPAYAAGDTAFFRAAFLTAEEMLPVKGPQILQLDLINYTGEVKLHQEFRVKNGWDGSQIIVPQDLAPGRYRIKAYCDWMKNFGESLFYAGQLEVVGENKFESVADLVEPEYYPEGGNLVSGLKNKIVIQGFPNAGKGSVVDDTGNAVADFQIGKNGYGFFYLTPGADRTYNIVLGQQTKQIRQASPEGVAMLLTPNNDKINSHRILLQASPGMRNEDLFLLVSGHGTIFYSALLQFKDKEYLAVVVPTAELPEGVATVTVLRANGDELASRLIYTRKNASLQSRIILSKPEVTSRENVSLSFSVVDDGGKPVTSNISVTVYNEDLLGSPSSERMIEDYLRGTCNVVTGDTQRVPGWDSAEADLFLITKTWPWYTWKQVIADQEKPKHYFDGYQKLNGKLAAPVADFDLTTSSKLTFYLESTGDVYAFETNDQGAFTGPLLFDFFDREEIFYRAERNSRKLSNTTITLDEERIAYHPSPPAISTHTINPYFHYAVQKNLIASSYRFFDGLNADLKEQKEGANLRLEDELWGAEFEIDLDDFTIFPTMQETVHEIIPWLQNRKRDGKDVLRLYLPDRSTNGEESPIFMIDGILTDDADYFLGLKPVNVDKIKLITKGEKLSKLGALGKNGLVLVETKIPGNAAKVSRNNSSFFAQGLTRPIAFSGQRSWQAKTSRVPRMQTCLFWNANLPTNQQGEASVTFQTSDDTGRFRIVIEGLTRDGRPFQTQETFRVTFGRISH